jgi:glucosamine--fructose-6-phosphate aminotransferase (isomerizing)
MHDAIASQPGALRTVLRDQAPALAAAAERLRVMERVVLTGIGTSWHATLVGELLFGRAGGFGLRARALHAFEFHHAWPAPDAATGVVVVSHRGTKRFSLEALGRSAGRAGVSVAITGRGHGEGLTAADVVLRTVEQEASAAHTVSYTCALVLLAALAAEVGRDRALRAALAAVPDQLAALLAQESWDALAARFQDRRSSVVVGSGPNTATALEAALKLNEACHVSAVGMHTEQFLHGPWVALEPADLVVVIAPPGPGRERAADVARLAREVGAPVLVLADGEDQELTSLADHAVALPRVPELLSPILAVVPLQLVAYHLALRRGVNPDVMRGDQPAHRRARAGLRL